MTILGLDVSHHQGEHVDWRAVATAGYAFAFCKATEGTHYVDPTHAYNVCAARAAGLLVGSYHYARPADSRPLDQARHFAGQLGAMGPRRLPAVLDLEETGGLSPARLQTWARAFLHELDRMTGRTSILYTGRAFYRDQLAQMTGWPLWLARYGSRLDQAGVTFWQHSSSAGVVGIPGPVDEDVFFGDRAALEALAGIPTQRRQAPAPPQEEDNMRIYVAPDKASVLVGAKEPFVALTPLEEAAWRAAGVPVIRITPAQHEVIVGSLQK